MKVLIVTGMSGAGKTTAMKMLEDMGYYCIDNLPIQIIDKLVDLSNETAEMQKVALGIDVRSGNLVNISEIVNKLKAMDIQIDILFLDAEDEVLIKRFKETRRNHPLALGERIDKGIQRERKSLEFLKKHSSCIIDTSHLLTRELKSEIEKIYSNEYDYKNMFVTILSFGFKYGIPTDSDLVIDVRFLPNPYYIEDLRPKTGNDKEIQDYVMQFRESTEFLDKLEDMVRFLLPKYIGEGKNQLVISIGCTGGKHRSVTLANELYNRLQGQNDFGLKIEHRDIGKDSLRGK